MSTKQNIVIDQGATYEQVFATNNANNEPYNFSGFSGAAQLRKNYASDTYVAFQVVLTDGLINLSLTPEQTANIAAGRYMYDIVITDSSGTVTRPVEGIATITPAVTHS